MFFALPKLQLKTTHKNENISQQKKYTVFVFLKINDLLIKIY